jgi:hypothetical protein
MVMIIILILIPLNYSTEMHDYLSNSRKASLEEVVLDVDDDRQPGLKNRMLPRKPNSGLKTDLNNTLADNISDEDVNKTQSDEGLLNEKKVSSRDLLTRQQKINQRLPVCYGMRRWCGCIVSLEVSFIFS